MKLFTKKAFKKQNSVDGNEEIDDSFETSTSPIKSSAKSPTKSSKTPIKKSELPASPPSREPGSAKPQPRVSRTFARQATVSSATSSSRRSKKIDPDLHPLNLPPEERKRFSELSRMSGRNSMDVDKDSPARAASSSPPPQQTQGTQGTQVKTPTEPQTTAQQQTNSFALPVSNGTNGTKSKSSDNDGEDKPVPPPHRDDSSPPPDPAEEAESFKNEGNRFFKAGDYTRAISFYTKAVTLQPESATYLGNRAAAFMSAEKYKEALEDCKKAVDLEPSNQKILLRLARIYTKLGLPEDAMATYSRMQPPPSAKDMEPAKSMLQYLRAAESALKDGTAASMVTHPLDMAERLLPFGIAKPRKWQLMRGAALLKMGDVNSLGEAQNIAMSLLRSNNQDPEALVLRGRALYAQGENDKAIQHFRKALQCDPEFKDAIKWLRIVQKLDRTKEEGNSEYKAGRWQSAIEKYTAALDIDPTNKGINSKILQNRALCRIKRKQYDDAISDCERAIALDPSYLKARKTKANALGQAERWEDAVREWKAIQEQDPEDRSIAKEIRRVELEMKKAQRKDYYKILGVEKDADENQIKKAYRKAAIVHHPDKNPGDAEAEARFKDISEAYETLIDPQKRARYENGDDLMDASDMFGGGGGGMHVDPEILFSMMGQGGGFGGAGFRFAEGGRPRSGFSSNQFHFG